MNVLKKNNQINNFTNSTKDEASLDKFNAF